MNEIEAALAAWTPRTPQIDRDRLMFAAGGASHNPAILAGRSPVRYLWPLATSLSTAAALAMAFLLAHDRAGRGPAAAGAAPPIAAIASPPRVAINEDVGLPARWELPPVPDGTYLALRNQLLTTPVDEWPVSRSLNDDARPGAAAVEDDADLTPPTSRNLLREFLPTEPPVRRGSPDPAVTPAAQITESNEALT